MRGLIVEDDPYFKRIVELRLRNWRPDIELLWAETLAAARLVLDDKQNELAFVILDQRLPDGSGADLLTHPRLADLAVLAVSADESPELPAEAVKAGAQHFLGKKQVSEPLFLPLLAAIISRKEAERELMQVKIRESRMATIKTLLGTLRHEINNPLGAVLGGAYLVRSGGDLAAEQAEVIKLIEASGKRISHVLNQLCEAAELEEVVKANESVFQIPGDAPWGKAEAGKKVKVGRKEKKVTILSQSGVSRRSAFTALCCKTRWVLQRGETAGQTSVVDSNMSGSAEVIDHW